jgi:chemotaxis protein CheD
MTKSKEQPTIINVGIEDIQVASGKAILRTTLGSCIAICLYDAKTKSGGMAHIMLPSLEDTKNVNGSPKKYADTAIPLLLYDIINNGGKKDGIFAKIAGGAQMFNLPNTSAMGAIGLNNILKVREVLREMKIKILTEDTGGDYSRTIFFDLNTGLVTVKVNGRGDTVI